MIHFNYRLLGSGWAVATIADEHDKTTFPASYLCDALRDFVDAVQGVFVMDSTECVWEQEPGEVRWEFRRNGTRLSVNVRWHDRRDGFSGDEDLLRFAHQVDTELDDLLATWGAEGYLKQWHYPFPQEAHNKLKAAMKLEKERRKAAK